MYSILCVDDEPSLLEVIKLFLEKSKDFLVDVHTSAQDALSSGSLSSYDAIVADYQMPGMDGIAFLKTVREMYGDIPFILFTGKGREEIVIQAINNGADFYLQKGGDPVAQFAELMHKIRQAIARRRSQHELKTAYEQIAASEEELRGQYEALVGSEQRIRESEQNYRLLFETATEGILIAQGDRMVLVNPAMILLLGYPEEILTSKPFTDFIHPDDRELVLSRHLQRMRGETPPTGYTFRIVTSGGQEKWVLISSTLMTWFGKPASLSLLTDITEQKKAEESLLSANMEYTNLLDQIQDVYYRSDAEGRLIKASRSFATLLGYSDISECIGRNIADNFYINPSDRQRFFDEVHRNGKVTGYEILLKKKDGTQVIVESNSHLYHDPAGNVIGIEGIFRDITERKRAEEALRKSEERLSSILQGSPVLQFVIDSNHKVISWNKALEEYSGITTAEILGTDQQWRAFYPERRPVLADLLVDGRADRIPELYAGKFRKSKLVQGAYEATDFFPQMGSGKWLHFTAAPILDANGTTIGSVETLEDITERKQAEEALRNSEEKFRQLVTSAPLPMGLTNNKGEIEFINNRFTELFGYTLADVPTINDWYDRAYPDKEYRKQALATWDAAVKMGLDNRTYIEPAVYKVTCSDGSVRDVIISGITIGGKLLATFIDITEQRKMEEALRKSEEKYRTLVETTGTGFVNIDDRGCVLDANPEYVRMTGYSDLGEIAGRNVTEWTAEYEREKNAEAVRQCVRDGYIRNFEVDYTDRSGRITPIEVNATVLQAGGSVQILTLCRDITERKRSEEALRKSEERYRLLVNNTEFPVVVTGITSGNALFINESASRFFGVSFEEMQTLQARDFWVEPADRERFAQDLLSKGKLTNYETRLKTKKGEIRWTQINATVIDFAGERAAYIIYNDITDRKKAETKLLSTCEQLSATEKELREQYNALALSEQRVRESETKFRAIIDHTFEFIGLMKPDGTVLEANESALAFAGISVSDVLNRPFWETPWWAHSKKLQGELKEAIKKAATGETVRFEATHPAADGHLATVDFSLKPVRDSAGRIQYLIPEGRDITERKHVEEALLASEQKYRSLIETTDTGYVIIDDLGRVLDANSAYVRLTGNTEINEIAGRSVLEWTAPYDKEKNADAVRKCIAEGFIHNFEIDYSDASGTITPVEINATAIRSGDAVQILTLCRDISGRRKSQYALKESEEKYRTLVDHSQDGVFIVQDGRLVFYNRAFAEMTGYNEEELLGRLIPELIAPEDREMAMARHRDRVAGKPAPESYEFSILHHDGSTKVRVRMFAGTGMYRGRPATIGTFHNVTEDRKREDALRESEERFRRLVSGSFDAVVIHEGGRIVLVNDAAVQIVGAASTADLVGKPILDLVHPDLRAIVKERIDRLVQSPEGTAPLLEEKFIRLDGSFIDVEVMATAMKHEGRPAVMVVFRDISGRKKVEEELRTAYMNLSAAEQELRGQYEELAMNEEALRESEEKFRALVETTSDFIWEVDEHGTYTYVSPQMKDLLGYEPSEILGKTSFDLMPPDEAQRVGAEFSRIVESRLPIVVLENKNFRKDGTIVVLETSGVPRFTDDGRFIGYRGIDRDITDRKRAEEALRESEEKYRLLVDNIPFGITLIDVDHRIIISNAAQGQMFHTDSGLWPGRYCYREFEKRDTVCTHCPGTRAMATGICHDVETEGVRDDGTRFNARIHAIPLHNPEGRITGFIEIVEDITESKLAENALRESEKKYRHVLENMQDAYFRADRDGNLTMVNPSAVRMYGFGSADEMIGIPAASLYDNPEQREGLLRELKEKGVVTDLTGKGRRKDGTTFWASMNAQFIIDDDGRILGTEGIVRDISERRTMENAIHEVNRKLNLLNSITRHDVANQLTALRGYTQIAMIRKPEPVISDLLTKIDAAAETIASQIEFTKVYQEMGLKDPAWFRIEDVVSKAGYQQVKFSNTCRSNEIFADPMLERIFLNLFDNSIRHGEKVTEITVRCERAPGGLLIIVEDDGVGIPPEEKEKIFEKGFGKHTGFGLFLAKEVLSLTGITIRETGVFQNGARFEILVPKGLYRIVPQTIRPDQG